LVIPTDKGNVLGAYGPRGRVWIGIPYAEPPLGPLRWQAPQPLTSPWNGTLNVSNQYPPYKACYQSPFSQYFTLTEDCLIVNVYSPYVAPPGANLSVIVYIHGGLYKSGGGLAYDGSYFNSFNVVYVSLNYRLGAFGFLALNELAANNTSGSTGFYGIQDQRLALQWVKNNIYNFGGDPNKVTLYGESAGAHSICIHLASTKSAGLFNKAILSSANCRNLYPKQYTVSIGNTLLQNLGCNSSNPSFVLSCLRNASSAAVLAASPIPPDAITPWRVSIDEVELTQEPISYVQAGNWNKVPILLGNNFNEYSDFLCPLYSVQTFNSTDYNNLISVNFGSNGTLYQDIPLRYPISNYPNPLQAAIDIFSDCVYKCPTKQLADAAYSTVPVFYYSLEDVPGFATACYGAAHSFDLLFIFSGLPSAVFSYTLTPAENILSAFMMNSWTLFANSSNPNGAGANWPQYNSSSPYIRLNTTLGTGIGFKTDACQLWNNGVYVPLPATSTSQTLSTTVASQTLSTTVASQTLSTTAASQSLSATVASQSLSATVASQSFSSTKATSETASLEYFMLLAIFILVGLYELSAE
jgi:para-nitrobenzyl esterase